MFESTDFIAGLVKSRPGDLSLLQPSVLFLQCRESLFRGSFDHRSSTLIAGVRLLLFLCVVDDFRDVVGVVGDVISDVLGFVVHSCFFSALDVGSSLFRRLVLFCA